MSYAYELGVTVKDKVTGFSGIVVGRSEFMTGCNQYAIQPKSGKEGGDMPKSYWLDEQRLDVVKGQKQVTLDNSKGTGCDVEGPSLAMGRR